MYGRLFVCMFVYVFIHMCAHMHISVSFFVRVCVHMFVCMCIAWVFVCVFACACVCCFVCFCNCIRINISCSMLLAEENGELDNGNDMPLYVWIIVVCAANIDGLNVTPQNSDSVRVVIMAICFTHA